MNSRFPIVFLAASLSAFAQTNTPNLRNAQIKTATPTNFVLQILEPTDATVQRPKDWSYAELFPEKWMAQPPRPGEKWHYYSWSISPEDPSKATLVLIQTIVGVKEHTGKTPKEFIQDVVIPSEKMKADKVLKCCTENKHKSFTRISMETELGQDHRLYSFFWSNDLDVAVVSRAVTTKDLWDTYSPVFYKMNGFELIDMKRTDK